MFWLLLLLAAKADLRIKYTFTENFDVLVVDTSGNLNHGTKDAPGTTLAVNTPQGLWLDRMQVHPPPNSKVSYINYSSPLTFTLFFRVLESNYSTNDWTLFEIRSSYFVTVLKLSKRKSPSPSAFDFLIRLGTTDYTRTSGVYPLGKSYIGEWLFAAVVLSYDVVSYSTTCSLFINDSQEISFTQQGAFGVFTATDRNSLGGFDTKGFFYEFRHYDSALSLADMKDVLFKAGSSSCSGYAYACFVGLSNFCRVSSFDYDNNCAQCLGCSPYGCRDEGQIPDICMQAVATGCTDSVYRADGQCRYTTNEEWCQNTCTDCSGPSNCNNCFSGYSKPGGSSICQTNCSLPPYTDANCSACYQNSKANAGATGCECKLGYFAVSGVTPLRCDRKA
jgi:hypothetical protein